MRERDIRGYYLGLELGRIQDYTALAIAEKETVYTNPLKQREHDNHYQIRHLERFSAGTSYPQIVERVAALMLTPQLYEDSRLLIDATGVALPVAENFERLVRRKGVKGWATKVLITNGDTQTRDGSTYRVPRRDLASTLQVLLSYDRLKIAPALPDAGMLSTELANFQVKVMPAGTPDDLIWREAATDDLVLAVALACWGGENRRYATQARVDGIV
jgi:hypothetical protein